MKYQPYQYKFRPVFSPKTRSQQMIDRQMTEQERRRLQEYLLQSQSLTSNVLPKSSRRQKESPMMLSFGQMPNMLRQQNMIKRKKTTKKRT